MGEIIIKKYLCKIYNEVVYTYNVNSNVKVYTEISMPMISSNEHKPIKFFHSVEQLSLISYDDLFKLGYDLEIISEICDIFSECREFVPCDNSKGDSFYLFEVIFNKMILGNYLLRNFGLYTVCPKDYIRLNKKYNYRGGFDLTSSITNDILGKFYMCPTNELVYGNVEYNLMLKPEYIQLYDSVVYMCECDTTGENEIDTYRSITLK